MKLLKLLLDFEQLMAAQSLVLTSLSEPFKPFEDIHTKYIFISTNSSKHFMFQYSLMLLHDNPQKHNWCAGLLQGNWPRILFTNSSSYNNNKHSLTHHCMYLFAQYTICSKVVPVHIYCHNFRTNGIVCKWIHTVVCQTVFIITVIQVTHQDDPNKD
jgi:hypothetical protein